MGGRYHSHIHQPIESVEKLPSRAHVEPHHYPSATCRLRPTTAHICGRVWNMLEMINRLSLRVCAWLSYQWTQAAAPSPFKHRVLDGLFYCAVGGVLGVCIGLLADWAGVGR